MANTNKKHKRNLTESNSENDIKEFLKCIEIKSLEETLLTVASLTEKIISSRDELWRKLEPVIVEVDKKKSN